MAPEIRGASPVACALKGAARGASPATIEGQPGAAWVLRGRVRAAFVFTIERGKISGIDFVMDPGRLAELDVRTE